MLLKVKKIDPHGFQKALRPIKVRVSQAKETSVDNHFKPLEEVEAHNNGERDQQKGRGDPSSSNG